MEEERGARWKVFAVSLTTLADLERQWDNLSFPSIDNAADDAKIGEGRVLHHQLHHCN